MLVEISTILRQGKLLERRRIKPDLPVFELRTERRSSSNFCARRRRLDPKLYTLNPKPQTWTPKP